jgi:hypothetical protein
MGDQGESTPAHMIKLDDLYLSFDYRDSYEDVPTKNLAEIWRITVRHTSVPSKTCQQSSILGRYWHCYTKSLQYSALK